LSLNDVMCLETFTALESFLDNQSFGRVRCLSPTTELFGLRFWFARWKVAKAGFTDSEYEGDDSDPIKLNA
jgi:hypothetical protein